MNLIMNASESIGDMDGVITVTTSHIIGGPTRVSNNVTKLGEGDYIRLEVSDTWKAEWAAAIEEYDSLAVCGKMG
jgi:hypothetical protein